MAETASPSSNMLNLTADIVAAFVSNNSVSSTDLPGLISATHSAITGLATGVAPEPEAEDLTRSKADIRRSIGKTHITSFIDGKGYRSLKRHLTTHGYTPETYRATFGLPADFPMVHPEYAARRSELAKASGLGQGGRQPKKATGRAKKA